MAKTRGIIRPGSTPSEVTDGDVVGLEIRPRAVAASARRVAALGIDWVASLLVVRLTLPDLPYGSPAAGVATMGVFALEVTLLTWLSGSSFGQRITGIAVVGRSVAGREVAGDRPLGLAAVALRTLLVCLVIPAVIWDNDGRGLHDRAAGSQVVRR